MRSKKRYQSILLLLLAGLSLSALGLKKSDLSEEARSLLPEGALVTVEFKDGSVIYGVLKSESDRTILMQVRLKDGSYSEKTIFKSKIKKTEPMDVSMLFAIRLKELAPEEKEALEKEEYKNLIFLCDEFLEKCKGSKVYKNIAKLKKNLEEDLGKLEKGMKMVDGEWYTPVRAAVREFDLYTEKLKEVKKKGDIKSNKKAKEFYDKLEDQRRETARELPRIMTDRLPKLLEEKRFDEATEEMHAFLQFWLDQVVQSEGSISGALREMDFGHLIRLQEHILEAYFAAGGGAEKPARMRKTGNMVFIPGGYFLMGDQKAKQPSDTFPCHIVYVSPFLIDRHEVTNKEYRQFVEYVKRTGDNSMAHPDAPPLKDHAAEGWKKDTLNGENQPVVGVDWFDAYAYSNWKKKRLPTEAEWEKAAGGYDYVKFPWGDENPEKGAANYRGSREYIASQMDSQLASRLEPPQGGCSCVRKVDTKPPPKTRLPRKTWDVDSVLPEKAKKAIAEEMFLWDHNYTNANGLFHMAGNAAEWVSDFYESKYYMETPLRDPKGPENGRVHVFRGGSYLTSNPEQLRVYERFFPKGKGMKSGVSGGNPFIGFRCARSIDIVQQN